MDSLNIYHILPNAVTSLPYRKLIPGMCLTTEVIAWFMSCMAYRNYIDILYFKIMYWANMMAGSKTEMSKGMVQSNSI